jgi:mannobiose 2-epimerase
MPQEIREKNYGLDHVSFGHDYETAFLMLEASIAWSKMTLLL